MTVSHHSNEYRDPAARGMPMPPPVIPKQRIPRFTWLMIAFAVLVLIGIVASFVRVADEPRPLLDVPETEAVPATPGAPDAPR